MGLLAGAVKLSVDQGVWSTGTDKTSKLFEQVKCKVLPGTIVYPEKVISFALNAFNSFCEEK